MEDGLLSLKWNNHKSTFFHILSSLRKKETYTDATLACEGKFFAVHKLVMSTCSDYFSEVFERTNCKSPVVILKDIKHHDLEALLDYMYLGEVDVKQSELAGLIKAAECLRIKGLAVPDEDPTLSQRKAPHVPEHRSSPAAKRIRRESGGGVGSDASSHHYANKNRKSLSPLRSHSSSALSSTSVPSQSVNSDTLSQVPSSLSMHPPSYSDTRHSDLSSSSDNHKHVNQSSLVPVDMIKVEVEDEGNSNNSQVRRTQDGPPDLEGGREESRGEGGEDSIGEGRRDKESLANNFSEYSGHPGEIEKEEHDQLDSFNGSDQIPGPSGVQGGSQMMNWGEEEGNFPHNLFGGDDSSHQQVLFKIEETNEDDPSDPSSRTVNPWPHSCLLSSNSHQSGNRVAAALVYYNCPLCSKGFTDKYKLKRHLVTHTGEKPFACTLCPCKYTRNDKLKEHLRRVHRVK